MSTTKKRKVRYKDCWHRTREGAKNICCNVLHPVTPTGEILYQTCKMMREADGLCGPIGRYFMPGSQKE